MEKQDNILDRISAFIFWPLWSVLCFSPIFLLGLIIGFIERKRYDLIGAVLTAPLLYFLFTTLREKLFFKFVPVHPEENLSSAIYSIIITLSVLLIVDEPISPYFIFIFLILNLLSFCITLRSFENETIRYMDMKNYFEINKMKDYVANKEKELNNYLSIENKKLDNKRIIIQEREDFVNSVINGDGYLFNKIPSFIADMQSYDFSITEKYLLTKKHPAHKKAMEVSELKLKYKEAVIEAKISKYKLEGLVNIFPELENFIHSEEDFRELDEYIDIADVKDNYDRVRYYVTKDEYEAMSTTERNQLALDRYINRPKTKGEIGIEYELCCARVLERMFGYKVIEHGLLYGKHDLGRDLICHDTTNNIIYIVQCKFWSRDREIRENVIMQLHGSAVAYGVTYNKTYRSIYNSKIVPVLMMPPQSVLSDTAKEFVEYLDIKVWRQKMCDFPRIKCNINNGNKIYHLPFDQQYKRTIIDKPGEFYAYTVAEAEAAGFRRAMRHFITN